MELFIYASALALLVIIDKIESSVWTQRHWSCGRFSLPVPMTPHHAALIKNGRYVVRKDDVAAGQISYTSICRDMNGLEQIEAQGRFFSHWIGKRIIEPGISMTARKHVIVQTFVLNNLIDPADMPRRILNLSIADASRCI